MPAEDRGVGNGSTGDAGASPGTVDPNGIEAAGTGQPAEPQPRKRGGRPRGSGTGGTGKAGGKAAGTSLDLTAAAGLWAAIHCTAASIKRLDFPELACTEDDARNVVGAWGNVARHYNIKSTQKTFDWIMAGAMTVAFYGPRIAVRRQRQAGELQVRRAAAQRSNGAADPSLPSQMHEMPPAVAYPINLNPAQDMDGGGM